jgi:hypothetical protein
VQAQRLLDSLVADGQEHLTAGWSDAGEVMRRPAPWCSSDFTELLDQSLKTI